MNRNSSACRSTVFPVVGITSGPASTAITASADTTDRRIPDTNGQPNTKGAAP